ncbi:MAG: class I SAM-dependent methyltransferase [Actinomycetota bacterium]|nr:class I SAM-dependent methyltransferase [Actinomycetota bacterium]
MNDSPEPEGRSYSDFYSRFDSALMRQLRAEAYGTDIGQHSWVTAEELEEDVPLLLLTEESTVLDLGCGPGGPLAFLVGMLGCRGMGVDVSAPAIASARNRAVSLDIATLVEFDEADLDAPLLFVDGLFDAAISLDVILHVRDRADLFREVARVLAPKGRFLFTDAGIITGAVSDDDIRLRAVHGSTHFVPPGFNETMLERAGFRLLERKDRTASLLRNARGRVAARYAHRAALEAVEGDTGFERQMRYLETVVDLAQRSAVSRMTYVAQAP